MQQIFKTTKAGTPV